MPYFWDLLLVHRSNIVIAFIDHASPTVNQYSRVKMEGRLIMRNPHGQMYHRNGIIFTRLTECLAISAQTLLSAKSAQELLSRFETIMAHKAIKKYFPHQFLHTGIHVFHLTWSS
jgi:hypothetical protein